MHHKNYAVTGDVVLCGHPPLILLPTSLVGQPSQTEKPASWELSRAWLSITDSIACFLVCATGTIIINEGASDSGSIVGSTNITAY